MTNSDESSFMGSVWYHVLADTRRVFINPCVNILLIYCISVYTLIQLEKKRGYFTVYSP